MEDNVPGPNCSVRAAQINRQAHSMPAKIFALVVLAASGAVSAGTDWRAEIGRKVDALVVQMNDGCSSEVKEARTLYQFGTGDDQIYAALISIEGYHCGNGNTEYLAVYRTGSAPPKNEAEASAKTLWLSALATVGGRGERLAAFNTLKWQDHTFTLNAKAYKNDAMCCPSVPIILRYKLSVLGLSELPPDNSLEQGRGK